MEGQSKRARARNRSHRNHVRVCNSVFIFDYHSFSVNVVHASPVVHPKQLEFSRGSVAETKEKDQSEFAEVRLPTPSQHAGTRLFRVQSFKLQVRNAQFVHPWLSVLSVPQPFSKKKSIVSRVSNQQVPRSASSVQRRKNSAHRTACDLPCARPPVVRVQYNSNSEEARTCAQALTRFRQNLASSLQNSPTSSILPLDPFVACS